MYDLECADEALLVCLSVKRLTVLWRAAARQFNSDQFS